MLPSSRSDRQSYRLDASTRRRPMRIAVVLPHPLNMPALARPTASKGKTMLQPESGNAPAARSESESLPVRDRFNSRAIRFIHDKQDRGSCVQDTIPFAFAGFHTPHKRRSDVTNSCSADFVVLDSVPDVEIRVVPMAPRNECWSTVYHADANACSRREFADTMNANASVETALSSDDRGRRRPRGTPSVAQNSLCACQVQGAF